MGIFKYLSKNSSLIGRKNIKSFSNSAIYYSFSGGKAGIYKGAKQLPNGNLLHVWATEITVDPKDHKKVLTWDEAEEHAKFICEKYNIFGPETGSPLSQDIQAISNNMITFEEVIDKNKND